MSPGLRKFLVTALVVAVALMVVGIALRSLNPTPTKTPDPATSAAAPQSPPTDAPAKPATESSAAPAPTTPTTPPTAPSLSAPVTLTARPAHADRAVTATRLPEPLGSLDPAKAPYQIDFAAHGAGISRIAFADFWKNASAKERARRHRLNPEIAMPSEDERYVLAETIKMVDASKKTFDVPVFAAHSVEIDGNPVALFGSVWSEEAPGRFATEIVDESGKVRYRIEREFSLGVNYEFGMKQSVTNLTDAPANVRWIQYGPSDLGGEPTMYVDARRVQFGYLLPTSRDPSQDKVISVGQMFERAALVKMVEANQFDLWPNKDSQTGMFTVSWFGSKNRYFTLCVHAPWSSQAPTHSLAQAVEAVKVVGNQVPAPAEILTELHAPARSIAPASSASYDMGVYAGPLDPQVLNNDEPYASLNMGELIVYMLSPGCCSFCTFAWLANAMAAFLFLLHRIVFDWGLAIIVLVVVVRLLLHPIMKRSQVQMQRFSRAMSTLKPELDALQKRYPGDTQKIQQEQLRLYREKGVNPVGCLSGIVPSFLQMPIWIALYAVLFFSFELRQSPAFFGFFQMFGGWQFLGDLSRPDNFIPLGTEINIYLTKLNSVNLLPILMGIVFFIQQKYMTPPQANLTPEQESQQKMMKWMMILLFPALLYTAPSGLTLYIMTSTCIGIWESKMVKKHIEKFGFETPKKPKKQDRLGKMYEQMLERAREKQAEKGKKTYKERE